MRIQIRLFLLTWVDYANRRSGRHAKRDVEYVQIHAAYRFSNDVLPGQRFA